MNIIAHRGLWRVPEQKNSMAAFSAAIDAGFGIETDVREYNGRLVLSHDIADGRSVPCEDLFRYYTRQKSSATLALNIKEDGIQNLLLDLITGYEIQHYFFFDMSVPEMVVYRRMGMPYFTRQSDIESTPILYEDAAGVWLDAFYEDWNMIPNIKTHLQSGKKVSLISPELHGRNEAKLWNRLWESRLAKEVDCFLCTDCPEKARELLGG